jgi:hypothetical protein
MQEGAMKAGEADGMKAAMRGHTPAAPERLVLLLHTTSSCEMKQNPTQ